MKNLLYFIKEGLMTVLVIIVLFGAFKIMTNMDKSIDLIHYTQRRIELAVTKDGNEIDRDLERRILESRSRKLVYAIFE